MASGKLVDDTTMGEVVADRLASGDAQGGFILDGYPRTPEQVATLERILTEASVDLDAVLAIEVPKEVLTERALARRRDDDREDVIRARFQIYQEKTEPLLDYYEQRDLLLRIDGHQSIEEVTAAVLEAMAVEA